MSKDDTNKPEISNNEEEEEISEEEVMEINSILGDTDRVNCTYAKGYISRQAVYSCLTCCTPDQPAIICVACCANCHEGHNFLELYTKRNLRCDCGNEKFKNNPCTLNKDKDDVNMGNTYNHNFQGKYCTCHRPFPDEENQNEKAMIQCVVCEDWFHENHLGDVKEPEEFAEMICEQCVTNHPFLMLYKDLHGITETNEETDNEPTNKKPKLEENIIDIEKIDETEAKSSSVPSKPVACSSNSECLKPASPCTPPTPTTLYMIEGWRSKICSCKKCKADYKDNHIDYITDENDTLSSYEDRGTAIQNTPLLEQLTEGMDRYSKGEVMMAMKDIVSNVESMLKNLKDSGESMITEDHIEDLFKKMSEKRNKEKK